MNIASGIVGGVLLLLAPAFAVAQDQKWPAGSAMATGAIYLEEKAKAVEELERANADLDAILSAPAYQQEPYLRSVAAVRSLKASSLDYISQECELVGASTLAASTWQSTHAVGCEVALIKQRTTQVVAAKECLAKAPQPVYSEFPACVRLLAPLAAQAGVK
jgi:hypothetical protein